MPAISTFELQRGFACHPGMNNLVELKEPFKSTEVGELPVSWQVVPLGEAFDVQQGKALSPSARRGLSPRPFLRTANVLWGRLDLSTVDKMDFAEDEAERLSLKPGDLLVCEGGEIGRTALWNGTVEGCLYQNHVHRLRRKRADVFPDFIMYWMQAAFLHLRLYGGVGNKTTIPNLSGARLKQLPIPLPPFPEQRAIAGVLGKIQTAVEVQEKIVATLKELKAATLAKLFREGLRGEPLKQTEIGEIPESWQVVPVGEYCEKPRYGYTESARSDPVGPKFLRITDITEYGVNWDSVPYCFCPEKTLEELRLRPGDLVFARIGATTGKSYFITDCPEAVFASYLIRLRAKPRLDPTYLSCFFESEAYWSQIRANKGANLKGGMSASMLSKLLFPLPPLEEQKTIAATVKGIEQEIASIVKRRDILKSLFSSMLHLLMTGQVRVSRKMIALQAVADRAARRPKWSGTVDRVVLQEIVRRVVEAVAPEKIILFGSAARREMGPDSDLDLLVVKACDSPREVERLVYRRLIGIGVPKDVLVVTPEHLEKHKDTIGYIYRPALREGKVIYAR